MKATDQRGGAPKYGGQRDNRVKVTANLGGYQFLTATFLTATALAHNASHPNAGRSVHCRCFTAPSSNPLSGARRSSYCPHRPSASRAPSISLSSIWRRNMPTRIFISYVRGDRDAALRIRDRLAAAFGSRNVFDDYYIASGDRWERELEAAIARSDVLLAVIGPRWLEQLGDQDVRHARQEIAFALNRNILVIPVLVGGASAPSPDALPDDIRNLGLVHYQVVSPYRFDRDVSALIAALSGTPALSPKARRRTADRRLLALGMLLGMAILGGPLALLFLAQEQTVIPSFFSDSTPAPVAHFSRSKLPNAGAGARLIVGDLAGDATARDTYFAVFEGVDFRGRSVGRLTTEDWKECAALCLQTSECVAFSFTQQPTECTLKADIAGTVPSSGRAAVLFQGWPKEFSTVNRERIYPVVYKITGVPERR
jgi:hypothetical protein